MPIPSLPVPLVHAFEIRPNPCPLPPTGPPNPTLFAEAAQYIVVLLGRMHIIKKNDMTLFHILGHL